MIVHWQVTPVGHANNSGQVMAPILLITRPEPSGAAFADRMRAAMGCGVEVILSPVLRIEHCGSLPDLRRYKTLIFTSRHAVEAYVALGGVRDIPAYAVGDATGRAAQAEGMRVRVCDGDAASVIARVTADKVSGPVLHLSGDHVARDIAKDLTQAGIVTDQAVIYRQVAVGLSAQACAALSGERMVVLPLFSPRSARLLFEGTDVSAPLLVAAISEAAAREVPADVAVRLDIARSPDLEAMVALTGRLLDAGKRLEGVRPAK